MKNICMLGKEYGEREINILVEFDRYMTNKFMSKLLEGNLTPNEIIEERDMYIKNANEEESEVITHYISANALNNSKPLLDMLVAIPCTILTSLISIFAIRLILSMVIAGMLTIQTKMFLDKRAYKKIMKLIKESTME